jgi:hypothetical protein
MSEIIEKLTNGLFITTSDEVVTDEPITVSEVKAYIGIDFTTHDTKLERLITACREQLELSKSVTLIDSRTVEVLWKELYDWENLPYSSITLASIEAVDIDEVVLDPTIVGVGGRYRVYGDFTNGIKLTYDSTQIVLTDTIKEGLIRAVKDCFEQGTTPKKAIQKEFQYVSI